MNYNRQQKRAMAKQGLDSPRAPERKGSEQRERTSPKKFLSEVIGELKKVDWPTGREVMNSSIIVLITVLVMTGLIFGFDYLSQEAVYWLIK